MCKLYLTFLLMAIAITSYSQDYFISKDAAISYLNNLFSKSFNKETVIQQFKDEYGDTKNSLPLKYNFEFTQNALIIYRANYSEKAALKKWKWSDLTWYILPYDNIKEVRADRNAIFFNNSSKISIDNICRCFKKGYSNQKIKELEEFRISENQKAEELLESGIDIPFNYNEPDIQTKLSDAFLALRLPNINTTSLPYDSLTNSIRDTSKIYQYIGQVFYLSPSKRAKENGGYFHFLYTTPSSSGEFNDRDWDYTYHKVPKSISYSDYDRLKGNVFKALGIAKNKNGKYFIQLFHEGRKEICYYKYTPMAEIAFPFIIDGYYVKLKEKLTGMEFKTTGDSWSEKEIKDVKTGKLVSIAKDKLWKVTSIYPANDTTDDWPGLIVELTGKGEERITVPLMFLNRIYFTKV